MKNDLGINKREQTPKPKELDNTKCLTFDEGLDNLISKSEQIFIAMTAKSSGTSMEEFTRICMSRAKKIDINFLRDNRVIGSDFLTDYIHLPKVMTSYVYNDEPLLNLIQ